MKTISYRTVDKSAWPRGPWDKEPDKVQWFDKASGLPCLAVRHREWGHWCGYVGVAEGHPLFELGDVSLEAHGGITFAAMCAPGEPEATGICHIAGPGEPEHVWWLGFDCAHAFDLKPNFPVFEWQPARLLAMRDVYRTLRYVRRECRELAEQLAGMKA